MGEARINPAPLLSKINESYYMGMDVTRSSNFEFWVRQNSPALESGKGLYIHDPSASEIRCLQKLMERGLIYFSEISDDRLHIRVLECFNCK